MLCGDCGLRVGAWAARTGVSSTTAAAITTIRTQLVFIVSLLDRSSLRSNAFRRAGPIPAAGHKCAMPNNILVPGFTWEVARLLLPHALPYLERYPMPIG